METHRSCTFCVTVGLNARSPFSSFFYSLRIVDETMRTINNHRTNTMANSHANSPSSNIIADPFNDLLDGNVVEAADIDQGKSRNFLIQLLDRMSPRNCLAPMNVVACHILEEDAVDFDDVMPGILRNIRKGGKIKTKALQKLYQMTDRERKQNRYVSHCVRMF